MCYLYIQPKTRKVAVLILCACARSKIWKGARHRLDASVLNRKKNKVLINACQNYTFMHVWMSGACVVGRNMFVPSLLKENQKEKKTSEGVDLHTSFGREWDCVGYSTYFGYFRRGRDETNFSIEETLMNIVCSKMYMPGMLLWGPMLKEDKTSRVIRSAYPLVQRVSSMWLCSKPFVHKQYDMGWFQESTICRQRHCQGLPRILDRRSLISWSRDREMNSKKQNSFYDFWNVCRFVHLNCGCSVPLPW
jgi:hypothetical protein